jgi:large subunit ribosomal protein L17
MIHQSGKVKLNLKPSHKKALIRNQVIHLIMYGHIVTTKARAQEMRRFAERLVTVARQGNTFNARRRAKSMLPYKEEALTRLFSEIAPRYTERAGGYTRLISLGRRPSDTAPIAKVEWV